MGDVDKDSRLIYLAILIWEGRDMDKLLTYLSSKINWGGKGYGQHDYYLFIGRYKRKQMGQGKRVGQYNQWEGRKTNNQMGGGKREWLWAYNYLCKIV